MAQASEEAPGGRSSSFSFALPRPMLPSPEWLCGGRLWGIEASPDLRSSVAIEVPHQQIDAIDPIEAIRRLRPPDGGFTSGLRIGREPVSSDHLRSCLPAAPLPGSLLSSSSPAGLSLLKQRAGVNSHLLNPTGRSSIPFATSLKWQDRVQGPTIPISVVDPPLLGDWMQCGTTEQSSPIVFRRGSDQEGDMNHEQSFEVGSVPEPACQQTALKFDLNCVPHEDNITGLEHSDVKGRATGNEPDAGSLDLRQFIEPSVEETSDTYSNCGTEVRECEEEWVPDDNNVPDTFGAGIGISHEEAGRSEAASSTGSMTRLDTGEEVNGPRGRRHYSVDGPNVRDKVEGKKSALEMALMKFADRSTPYIIDPAIGTEFDCVAEAFDYYNLYSWVCGFGIKYGRTKHSESKKNRGLDPSLKYILSVEIKCCYAGVPDKNQKVSGKLGCGAMIRLHRTQDHGYVVVEHRAQHNHPLSETCGEKRQWPSHKRIDKHTKDLVRILRENNIGVTKIYSILGSFFGSMSNVPTTKRNLRAICQKISREEAEEDIKKTLLVFSEFREADPGFLYSVDSDDDGRIKSLMRTNSRSRMQYAHFGDVVTFDTTYRTNLYDMPFGMFVGVNNHFQSVLFGGVLLTEETIESFQWVFKEFVSLMGGKKPQTILTDQCRAMEVAISIEWEGVAHRWCKWHVLKRVAECLGTKYTGNKEFRDKFHKMLNEMLTIEEFKKAWKELLAEYKLTENNFLKQVYKTKKKWAKSYFKGIFCAKQTSTQRSESANNMLKNLVPPGCTMHHFVTQYAKLLHTMDDNEDYEERRTKLFTRDLSMGGPLIAQAAKVYTYKVFGMFCKVKTDSEDYFATEVIQGAEYVAEHYNIDKIQRWIKGKYVVRVNAERTMFSCECGMYEHFGLPCCHSLRVMISIGMKAIPEKMIMRRWTRKARLILPAHLARYGEPNPALMAQTYRHAALFLAALELVKLGDSNVKCFHILMACFAAAKEKLLDASKIKDGLGLEEREAAKESSRGQNGNGDMEDADDLDNDLFPLRAPKRKRERGRPTNARERPGYEKLSKRPRFCKTCKAPDHKSDKCPCVTEQKTSQEHCQLVKAAVWKGTL